MRLSLPAAIVIAVNLAGPVYASDKDAADRNADGTWLAPEATAQTLHFGLPPASRGSLLPSLYVSLAALNAFDAYTTNAGVSRGASEANPLVRGFAGTPAMWAVKGATTATTIYFAERLWRRNQKAKAIAVMVVSNGLMAAVAAHNASVLRGQRVR